MSNLDTSVPVAIAGDSTGVGEAQDRTSSRASMVTGMTGMTAAKRWKSWRRIVGLLLLALTVFLWTASNFLAS
ncbi:hypothetical protein LTR33_017806, partial [Friedmanniomyces endolithicus]